MRKSNERRDVQIDDLEFAVEIEHREIATRTEPRVVDKPVDLPTVLFCFGNERLDATRFGQVYRNVPTINTVLAR